MKPSSPANEIPALPVPTPDQDPSEIAREIRTLSFRAAHQKHSIGYIRWRAIQQGKDTLWQPNRGGRPITEEAQARIIESVKSLPHLNTVARARSLGIRTATVQKVLASRSLTKSDARLQYAGYSVQALKPLAIARKRRVLASAPFIYTCCDFKTLGMVRGSKESPDIWIRGCMLIDQFTAYAQVTIGPEETSQLATTALSRFAESIKADFGIKLSGIILTDNGAQFTSDDWIYACQERKLIFRTTQFNHPWSNGKAESLNRTLKYQALPALLTGQYHDINQIQSLLDEWMWHYNFQRSHTGRCNRGLPPAVLFKNWSACKGDYLERLISLGLISAGDLPRLRVMGTSATGERIASRPLNSPEGIPYAFVLESPAAFSPLTQANTAAILTGMKSNVTLPASRKHKCKS